MSDCPHCDGSGHVETDSGAARCQCLEERLHKRKLRKAMKQLPPRLQDVEFDRWPVTAMPREQVEPVRRYTQRFDENLESGRGIWIAGGVGTGKSTLAASAFKVVSRAGYSSGFWYVPDLLQKMRGTYRIEGELDPFDQFFHELAELDLLVLDDVGVERATDWTGEQLDRLVEHRSRERQPLIVTTNLSIPHLRERAGDRVVSRLFGMCGQPLTMRGPDRREEPPSVSDGSAQTPDESPGAALTRPAGVA